MKNLMILLAMTLSSMAHAEGGGDKDNGGSVWDKRKNEALTKEELTSVLSYESKELKKTLEGLISYVDKSDLLKEPAEQMILDMKKSNRLIEDIRYANYNTHDGAFSENCKDLTLDACTENDRPGSTIYLNLENLEKNSTSFAELVGLLMHEHSRHFIGNADKKHKLAAFYENAYIKDKHLGKVYLYENGDFALKLGDETYQFVSPSGAYYIDESRGIDCNKTEADRFCRYQNFRRAMSYKLGEGHYLATDDPIKRWYFPEGLEPTSGNIKYNAKRGNYGALNYTYKEIICVN